jgi:hypothetical protein
MRVAVDQPGEDRHLRKVDYGRIARNGEILSHRFKLVRPNNDDLIGLDPARIRIEQPSCLNHGDLRYGRAYQTAKQDQTEEWFQFSLRSQSGRTAFYNGMTASQAGPRGAQFCGKGAYPS